MFATVHVCRRTANWLQLMAVTLGTPAVLRLQKCTAGIICLGMNTKRYELTSFRRTRNLTTTPVVSFKHFTLELTRARSGPSPLWRCYMSFCVLVTWDYDCEGPGLA